MGRNGSCIELTAVEPGVWQLRGQADRSSVDSFFRGIARRGLFGHSDAVTVRVDELSIADSAILALLVYWRLGLSGRIHFELNNQVLLNLIKVHRIESLFARRANCKDAH